jgi:hypothetical protein
MKGQIRGRKRKRQFLANRRCYGRRGRAEVRDEMQGRSGATRFTHDEELDDNSEHWELVLKGESE